MTPTCWRWPSPPTAARCWCGRRAAACMPGTGRPARKWPGRPACRRRPRTSSARAKAGWPWRPRTASSSGGGRGTRPVELARAGPVGGAGVLGRRTCPGLGRAVAAPVAACRWRLGAGRLAPPARGRAVHPPRSLGRRRRGAAANGRARRSPLLGRGGRQGGAESLRGGGFATPFARLVHGKSPLALVSRLGGIGPPRQPAGRRDGAPSLAGHARVGVPRRAGREDHRDRLLRRLRCAGTPKATSNGPGTRWTPTSARSRGWPWPPTASGCYRPAVRTRSVSGTAWASRNCSAPASSATRVPRSGRPT